MSLKTCSKCKVNRLVSEFDKNKVKPDGLQNQCKVCRQAYRDANKAKIRESDRQYRLNNLSVLSDKAKQRYTEDPDKVKSRVNKYYHANKHTTVASYRQREKEAISKRQREYRQNNRELFRQKEREDRNKRPERYRAKYASRRVRKLQATAPWADNKTIATFYTRAAELEGSTGVKWHVDHIDPLQGHLVCGLHVAENLQVLPASINCSKNNSFKPYIQNDRGTFYLDVKYKLVKDKEIYGIFL